MADDLVIDIAGLTKDYGGVEALRGLDLSVPRGSICGLLGRNGAGKTTTIKVLLGMVHPTKGRARVFDLAADVPASSLAIRKRTAYVGEDKDLYDFMTVEDMVHFTSGFFPTWRADVAARYLRVFDLPAGRRVKALSKGMRTKLSLVLALSRGAELLMLDEPTSGLDPAATEDVLQSIVKHVAEDGTTVFFSSHQIAEVEQIADRVAMIDSGRVAVTGAIDDLRERFRRIRLVFDREAPATPFRAPGIGEVFPPQFVMMDTKPERTPLDARTVRRGQWVDSVDWEAQPLLKRPFGVCRVFYPHFPPDYLRHLELPPTLALALYPPHPEHFDMLYKVLPDGIGTTAMTKLKRGQKVHMLGPLGRAYDVRHLRTAGVEEVHIIGGGVGMAPLILLVEALRYYSFPVKVFLGMASLQSLRYRDELAATFGEKPRDAYIYVDDLLAAGVKPADIFIACDRAKPTKTRGIPATNLFHGLVPEQYRRYLEKARPAHAVAFSCGPNRMMEVMTDVCRQANVPLKLLLEKRMGCGIGVCFSCVQKVRRSDGTEDYARVCMEGPVFDAKDILWNNNSKPNLEACGCAARC